MTRRQLERIVRQWIQRLGLERWEISIEWDDWDPDDGSRAYVWRSRDYETARLYFNPVEWPKWESRFANQGVVHELLHVMTREAEFVLELLDGRLAGDLVSTIETSHKHAMEGVVDALAWRLVDLAGVT